jgi:myo-inositol-1(or 4)-monophosphatase
VRRLGAAALELSYVASGRLDGFWELGLAPWDVAAAGLICQEVSIKVTNFNGQDFDPFDRSIIAVNKSIFDQVIKLVEK